jgi:hypothetical protein
MECLPFPRYSTADETAIANSLLQCTPVDRIWPGKKCTRCELKSLPCSPADQSRRGRPPKSQTSDHNLDLAVPQTANDSSPGEDVADEQSDYVKLYVL